MRIMFGQAALCCLWLFYVHVHAFVVHLRRQSRLWLLSTFQNDNDENSSRSSISDYVKGLHGGKYQFETVSSSVGHEFAESLYSGSSHDDEEEEEQVDLDEPLPKWVLKMLGGTTTISTPATAPVLSTTLSQERIQVTIQNDERSWERFYAFIVDPASMNIQKGMTFQALWKQSMPPFQVQPWTGQLAPRGGSPNLCDPSKPYSDSAVLEIACANDMGASTQEWWLVVGTEAEQWYYRL